MERIGVKWKRCPLQLKFALLNNTAKLPTRGSEHAAGLDLYANFAGTESEQLGYVDIKGHERQPIRTGVAVEIPGGHFGWLASRSGIAKKLGGNLLAGVIDCDYRGELIVIMQNHGPETFRINQNDRIGQLVVIPYLVLEPVQVQELSTTVRGAEGFGSTGQ